MAVTYTDRGEFQTAAGGAITMVASSSSFTPAAGTLLCVAVNGDAQSSHASAVGVVAVSDNIGDTAGGTWTRRASSLFTNPSSGHYRHNSEIWTRLVGTSPGSGTVTVTYTINGTSSTNDGWLWCNVMEVAGQHTSPIGAGSGNDVPRQTSGPSTYTATLSGDPASGSLVVATLHQNNTSTQATLSGYTTVHSEAPAWGATSATYSLIGDEDTTVGWTGCSTASGITGAALEIVAAAASGDATAAPAVISRPVTLPAATASAGWTVTPAALLAPATAPAASAGAGTVAAPQPVKVSADVITPGRSELRLPLVVATGNAAITASRSPAITFGSYTPLANDLVIMWASSGVTALTMTEPSGWTNPLGAGVDVESDSHQMACAWHLVTSGEQTGGTTTYTVTNWYGVTTTGDVNGIVVRYADPITPIDAAGSTFNSTNTVTPHVLAALIAGDIGSSNGLVASSVAKDATGTYTTPAGWTQRTTSNNTTGRWTGTRDTLTTAGVAVAAVNITPSAGDEYASITVAVTPAAAAVSDTEHPAVITAPSTLPAVTATVPSGDATRSPAALLAPVTLPAVSARTGWTVTPAVTVAPAALPAVTAVQVSTYWAGATPTETTDNTSSELGLRIVVNTACTLTGIRIWNPGEQSRTTRNAKLWSTNSSFTGQSQVTGVSLPSTFTPGWSYFTWDTPQVVSSVPAYYVVSYDCAATAAGSSDYGRVASVGFPITTADGVMTGPANAGVWGTADTYPTNALATFYGIDPTYAAAASDATRSPAAVLAPATLPAVTATGGTSTTATPAALLAPSTLPAVARSTGWRANPAVITTATTLPTSTPVTGRFPTAVSGNGRYLVDQNGNPWFGAGDSPWSMVGQLTTTEITTYLEDRSAKGVNLAIVSAPEPHFTSQTPDSNNVAGQAPFTGTAFQSTLNNSYWLVVDHAVAEAARLGITLLICPAYLGINDTEGWGAEINAASDANMTTYGQALAARYGTAPNIVWLAGHDRAPSATEKSRFAALFDAIQAGTPHLVTTGQVRGGLGSDVWEGSGVDYDFDTAYFDELEPAADSATGWAASPTMPFGWLEGRYEAEAAYANQYNDEPHLRSQLYGPLMAGATYAIFGNNPIWHFESTRILYAYTGTWESNLDSPGSLKLEIFAGFVASLNGSWATMTPDTTDTFLTAGEGTSSTRASARFDGTTGSGIVAVAYRPDGGSTSLTFDLTELDQVSHIRIRKFDPADGIYDTDYGTFATTGSQSVGTFGTNAAGDGDWIIVFEVPQTVSRTPATIATAVTMPPVTVKTGATPTPTPIAAPSTLPAAAAAAGSTLAPPPILAPATLPPVSARTGWTTAPATLLTPATLPAATGTVSATAAPAPTLTPTSLPNASTRTGWTVTAAVLLTPATTPPAAVSASGSATPTPTPIAAPSTLPQTVAAVGWTATAAPVLAPATLPAVSARTGWTVAPTVLLAPSTAPAVTVSGSGTATATPNPIAAPVTLPQTVARTGWTVTPSTLLVPATLPPPAVTAAGNATVTPVTLLTPTTLPAVTATGSSSSSPAPAPIAAPVILPAVAVRTGWTVTVSGILTPTTLPPAIVVTFAVDPALFLISPHFTSWTPPIITSTPPNVIGGHAPRIIRGADSSP